MILRELADRNGFEVIDKIDEETYQEIIIEIAKIIEL